MKVSIRIQTTQESTWDNEKSKQILLNPADLYIVPQSISFEITEFNYDGSLNPIKEMIDDWLKVKMMESIDIEAAKKKAALVKKLKDNKIKKEDK